MLLLTNTATLTCKHRLGKVAIVHSQDWVSIDGQPLLVDNDPENRSIAGCPNYGPTIKPCTTTLPVLAGYSDLLRIDGQRVCLDTVTGLTDGTPPGVVDYLVQRPGQAWVEEAKP
jgi:hypothetical protein